MYLIVMNSTSDLTFIIISSSAQRDAAFNIPPVISGTVAKIVSRSL